MRFFSRFAQMSLLCVSLLLPVVAYAHSSETSPMQLPADVQGWLDESTSEIIQIFINTFPGATIINRQAVAASLPIRDLLCQQAARLVALQDFNPEAQGGQFRHARLQTQPADMLGALPMATYAPLLMAAQHTAAGVAEIVCTRPGEWREALDEHFFRVGGK